MKTAIIPVSDRAGYSTVTWAVKSSSVGISSRTVVSASARSLVRAQIFFTISSLHGLPAKPPQSPRLVFERFRRGRSDRPGTGLGLAIVETLARRWGGTASIRNRETGGARAEVRLPVDRSARDLEKVS